MPNEEKERKMSAHWCTTLHRQFVTDRNTTRTRPRVNPKYELCCTAVHVNINTHVRENEEPYHAMRLYSHGLTLCYFVQVNGLLLCVAYRYCVMKRCIIITINVIGFDSLT